MSQALTQLEDGNSLFELPDAAGCRLTTAEVETDLMEAETVHDDYEEHHEEEDSGHDDHADEGHAEFHATYRFTCESPDALERLKVDLFDYFPGTEELLVQVISPRGQTVHEVTASDREIGL